ncbi:MAG: hypothetical protein S0880_05315 [Actinomycetota bacterium]|nr:hypothetical protein [Actinomycetota bacterium]
MREAGLVLPTPRRVGAIATLAMSLLLAPIAGAVPAQVDADVPQGEILDVGGLITYHPTIDNLADGRGSSCSFRLSFRNEGASDATVSVFDWAGAEIGQLLVAPGRTRTFTAFDNRQMQVWTNDNTTQLSIAVTIGGTTSGPYTVSSVIDPTLDRGGRNCLPNSQPPTTPSTTTPGTSPTPSTTPSTTPPPPNPAPPTTTPTPTTSVPGGPSTSVASPPGSVASTTVDLDTGGGTDRLPTTGRNLEVTIAGALWTIAAGFVLLTRSTILRRPR